MTLDLSVNNTLAVFNSNLIAQYVSLDVKALKMIFYLKKWNKENFPDPRKRLSSYAICLLVIIYLQNLDKPVLPRLQVGVKPLNKFYPQQYKIYEHQEAFKLAAKNLNPCYEQQTGKKYILKILVIETDLAFQEGEAARLAKNSLG